MEKVRTAIAYALVPIGALAVFLCLGFRSHRDKPYAPHMAHQLLTVLSFFSAAWAGLLVFALGTAAVGWLCATLVDWQPWTAYILPATASVLVAIWIAVAAGAAMLRGARRVLRRLRLSPTAPPK